MHPRNEERCELPRLFRIAASGRRLLHPARILATENEQPAAASVGKQALLCRLSGGPETRRTARNEVRREKDVPGCRPEPLALKSRHAERTVARAGPPAAVRAVLLP